MSLSWFWLHKNFWKRLKVNYHFLPFDIVVLFLTGFLLAVFLTVRFMVFFAGFLVLLFFGAVWAARLFTAVFRFLVAAVFSTASVFSLAFRFLVLAAFIAAALLWALVWTMLNSQILTCSYREKVNSFYSNE